MLAGITCGRSRLWPTNVVHRRIYDDFFTPYRPESVQKLSEGSAMQIPALFISSSSDTPPPRGKTKLPPAPVSEPSVDTTVKEAPGPDKKPAPVKATQPKLPHERDESVDMTPATPSKKGGKHTATSRMACRIPIGVRPLTEPTRSRNKQHRHMLLLSYLYFHASRSLHSYRELR